MPPPNTPGASAPAPSAPAAPKDVHFVALPDGQVVMAVPEGQEHLLDIPTSSSSTNSNDPATQNAAAAANRRIAAQGRASAGTGSGRGAWAAVSLNEILAELEAAQALQERDGLRMVGPTGRIRDLPPQSNASGGSVGMIDETSSVVVAGRRTEDLIRTGLRLRTAQLSSRVQTFMIMDALYFWVYFILLASALKHSYPQAWTDPLVVGELVGESLIGFLGCYFVRTRSIRGLAAYAGIQMIAILALMKSPYLTWMFVIVRSCSMVSSLYFRLFVVRTSGITVANRGNEEGEGALNHNNGSSSTALGASESTPASSGAAGGRAGYSSANLNAQAFDILAMLEEGRRLDRDLVARSTAGRPGIDITTVTRRSTGHGMSAGDAEFAARYGVPPIDIVAGSGARLRLPRIDYVPGDASPASAARVEAIVREVELSLQAFAVMSALPLAIQQQRRLEERYQRRHRAAQAQQQRQSRGRNTNNNSNNNDNDADEGGGEGGLDGVGDLDGTGAGAASNNRELADVAGWGVSGSGSGNDNGGGGGVTVAVLPGSTNRSSSSSSLARSRSRSGTATATATAAARTGTRRRIRHADSDVEADGGGGSANPHAVSDEVAIDIAVGFEMPSSSLPQGRGTGSRAAAAAGGSRRSRARPAAASAASVSRSRSRRRISPANAASTAAGSSRKDADEYDAAAVSQWQAAGHAQWASILGQETLLEGPASNSTRTSTAAPTVTNPKGDVPP